MYFSTIHQGRNGPFLYVLTIVVIILAYAIGQWPLTLAVERSLENQNSSLTVQEFFNKPDFNSIGLNANVGLLLMIFMFVMAFLALYLMVRFIHRKNFHHLINPHVKIGWNRILFGFILWFVLLVIVECITYLIYPDWYSLNFNLQSFLPLLLIALFLLPIQTSFEELFFRGYLLQGLYLLKNNKILVLILTTLLFAFVHSTNPEVDNYGVVPMMLYYATAGLLLGLVTIWDNGLELALGVHAATNIFSATIVSSDESVLVTESILRYSTMNIWLSWFLLVIIGALFIFICKIKFSWHLKSIFNNSKELFT